MSKSRGYVFTLNNYSDADYNAVVALECSYLVVGKEVGASGTPHLQGYVYYKNARSLSSVAKSIRGAHIEAAKGTGPENRAYCSKGGSFFEKGECPMDPKGKGQVEVERWELALLACRENRLDDIPADIAGRHLKSLEYAASKLGKRKLENLSHENVPHQWFYGPPGSGKSLRARTENPGAYIKDPGLSWWDGYANEDVVIIDDFDKYQVKQGGEMKRWLDLYPFKAPVKGGYLDIRPKKIVVTSNYHPDEIWEDHVTRTAICRRVAISYMDLDVPNPVCNIIN